jgi:hypothetical protein
LYLFDIVWGHSYSIERQLLTKVYRDKNGTVSRQKWDSKGTKMGQYRDKNGTAKGQKWDSIETKKYFCLDTRNISFLCTRFFQHIVHIEGFHIEKHRILRQDLCFSM